MRQRALELGLTFGSFSRGACNAITDVPGVQVGHATLICDTPCTIRTGVTAIIPAPDNLFSHPVRAGAFVVNGFGKTAGLVQVQELGRIETPIVLTNTLSVGTAMEAVVRYKISRNPGLRSVNPVIGECNDGLLNDIRKLSVEVRDVLHALKTAKSGHIETGTVGAGTGMVCFGYKGGIGTASRIIPVDGKKFTLGVLVLSNYGSMDQLTVCGRKFPVSKPSGKDHQDGSIMVIMGTDLPLSSRQLTRVAKRAAFGVARTGGTCSHGSGEIAIAFSTAGRMPKEKSATVFDVQILNENHPVISQIFEASIDCVEEAVIDSMLTATTLKGIHQNTIYELPVENFIDVLSEI